MGSPLVAQSLAAQYVKELPARNTVTLWSMPDPRIIMILPKDLVKKLDALAKVKGLSRAAYIRMVLLEHVRNEPSLSS